jgi:serine/threonine-protein kinase ULK4
MIKLNNTPSEFIDSPLFHLYYHQTVNEVQTLHKLNHTHIMKFHDWYETRSSLWLILEYCTGGDLDKILRSDGHLPETSVRIFGLDMLTGLKYLHSVGFIHNDLRPKNFLIDEYGILKLADFKYATKIPKEAFGNKPLEERGIPSYMAPECFTKEGVSSFQSDFWGLGCLLYELRRGILPFGDVGFLSLDVLRDNIRSIDPIQNPIAPPQNVPMGSTPSKMNNLSVNVSLPSISCELVDLLMWLLEKAPMNRCSW